MADTPSGESGGVRRFDAKQPVRWLAPTEIARGAVGEFFGGLFSKYVDNRDLQAQSRTAEIYRHPSARVSLPSGDAGGDAKPPTTRLIDGTTDGDADEIATAPAEFIVDYAADIGDGFGATYAIAELMARPSIRVEIDEDGGTKTSDDLPRGQVLLLGGDQVYPVANELDYDNRTVGPYLLAYQDLRGPDEILPVYAIPGNHDWYDGLVSFLQIFSDDGGLYRQQSRLKSVQRRSYYALALPHGWWIWGIDTGLSANGRVDLAQAAYFRQVFRAMGEQDQVIVVTAEPSWIKRTRKIEDRVEVKDTWDNLVAFLSDMMRRETQAAAETDEAEEGPRSVWRDHVRLVVSGDKHFYARHRPGTRESLPELITAGGGGAYLSSTWEVEDHLDLNVEPVGEDGTTAEAEPMDFDAGGRSVWPSQRTSLKLGLRDAFLLPARNPMMSAVVGFVYAVFAYAFVIGQIRPTFRPSVGENLDIALSRLRSSCHPRVSGPEELWSDCGSPLLSQVGRGTLDSFGAAIVALFIMMALVLFAMTGWSERTSGWRKVAAVIVASVCHIALHAVALSATLLVAVSVAIQPEGPEQDGLVRLGWMFVVLCIASALVLTPILWLWVVDRVRDLVPAVVLVAPWLVFVAVCLFVRFVDERSLNAAAVAVVLTAGLIGGAFGMMALTAYMAVSQFWKVHLNELFVGLRSENYKHFLRLRLTADDLTVYAVGYQTVHPRTVTWTNGTAEVTGSDLCNHRLIDHTTITRAGVANGGSASPAGSA